MLFSVVRAFVLCSLHLGLCCESPLALVFHCLLRHALLLCRDLLLTPLSCLSCTLPFCRNMCFVCWFWCLLTSTDLVIMRIGYLYVFRTFLAIQILLVFCLLCCLLLQVDISIFYLFFSPMVYLNGGYWWSLVVLYGGYWCSMVVGGALWWLLVLYGGGLWWLLVLFGGTLLWRSCRDAMWRKLCFGVKWESQYRGNIVVNLLHLIKCVPRSHHVTTPGRKLCSGVKCAPQ